MKKMLHEKKINFNRLDLDNYLEQHYNENQEEINPSCVTK